VIDCPDLPLNVSRSFLQNDGYVKKISAHITKKVADKLSELYKKERESYNLYWDDINMFIKYGCIRDEKFYDKVKDIMIYKDLDGNYLSLNEYLDGKEDKTVYYVSDPVQQAQYINLFKEQNQNAVMLPTMMDTHFISFIEMKEEGVHFKRIDSSLSEELTETQEQDEEKNAALIEAVRKYLEQEELKVEVQALKTTEVPAVLLLSEESRRMQEMYKSYGQQFAGMSGMFRDEFTFVLNSSNTLVQKLGDADEETAKLITQHIYDMAMLSQRPLSPEQMTAFIARNNRLLEKLI